METQTCCTPTVEAESGDKPPTNEAIPLKATAIRERVRDKYSQIAEGEQPCGCSMIGDAYNGVDGYFEDADLGLGCGLPVDHAGLLPGQTVLDLGSGAGLDVFVARRVVGEEGTVIGLDFSEAMVARARQNAHSLGYRNVQFVIGDIEQMPIPDACVDVVISNCVLNLVPDKQTAFQEIYRVLRSGGHFAISDVTLNEPLPREQQASIEAYVGCVAGAMEQDAYLHLVQQVGFRGVRVMVERKIPGASGVSSITVCGTKS